MVRCGDSTDPAHVDALLGGATPPLMPTDPPYGVNYAPEWRAHVDGGASHAVGRVANDHRVDWTAAYRLFTGDVVYAWHAGLYASTVAASLQAAGFDLRAQIIWQKQHFARHCQVADERAFFSLGAERPRLGQQAHVTSSH